MIELDAFKKFFPDNKVVRVIIEDLDQYGLSGGFKRGDAFYGVTDSLSTFYFKGKTLHINALKDSLFDGYAQHPNVANYGFSFVGYKIIGYVDVPPYSAVYPWYAGESGYTNAEIATLLLTFSNEEIMEYDSQLLSYDDVFALIPTLANTYPDYIDGGGVLFSLGDLIYLLAINGGTYYTIASILTQEVTNGFQRQYYYDTHGLPLEQL